MSITHTDTPAKNAIIEDRIGYCIDELSAIIDLLETLIRLPKEAGDIWLLMIIRNNLQAILRQLERAHKEMKGKQK